MPTPQEFSLIYEALKLAKQLLRDESPEYASQHSAQLANTGKRLNKSINRRTNAKRKYIPGFSDYSPQNAAEEAKHYGWDFDTGRNVRDLDPYEIM